jgi:hypothetical protein
VARVGVEGPAGFNLDERVDPIRGNGLDTLFAAGHKREDRSRADALIAGAMTGRFSAAGLETKPTTNVPSTAAIRPDCAFELLRV